MFLHAEHRAIALRAQSAQSGVSSSPRDVAMLSSFDPKPLLAEKASVRYCLSSGASLDVLYIQHARDRSAAQSLVAGDGWQDDSSDEGSRARCKIRWRQQTEAVMGTRRVGELLATLAPSCSICGKR